MLAPPPILVSADVAPGKGAVIVAAAAGCRQVALPDASGLALSFSGDRYAYLSSDSAAIWVGRVGAGTARTPIPAPPDGPPVFWHSRIAYASGRTIHLLRGGSVKPRLPRGARIMDLAADGDALAITATWGSGLAQTLETALFVYRDGATRRIEVEPDPYGEYPGPVWSPDGTRIAYTRDGDLWTIAADGTDAVSISHTPKALEGGAVWSPDSHVLAYWTTRNGPLETYVAPATGGAETRFTHTREPRRTGVVRVGTRPGAWRGDRIAVTTDVGIGTVDPKGGPLKMLCKVARGTFTQPAPRVAWP